MWVALLLSNPPSTCCPPCMRSGLGNLGFDTRATADIDATSVVQIVHLNYSGTLVVVGWGSNLSTATVCLAVAAAEKDMHLHSSALSPH